jgi:hypothetical protein
MVPPGEYSPAEQGTGMVLLFWQLQNSFSVVQLFIFMYSSEEYSLLSKTSERDMTYKAIITVLLLLSKSWHHNFEHWGKNGSWGLLQIQVYVMMTHTWIQVDKVYIWSKLVDCKYHWHNLGKPYCHCRHISRQNMEYTENCHYLARNLQDKPIYQQKCQCLHAEDWIKKYSVQVAALQILSSLRWNSRNYIGMHALADHIHEYGWLNCMWFW